MWELGVLSYEAQHLLLVSRGRFIFYGQWRLGTAHIVGGVGDGEHGGNNWFMRGTREPSVVRIELVRRMCA